jgi:hypothetical protein
MGLFCSRRSVKEAVTIGQLRRQAGDSNNAIGAAHGTIMDKGLTIGDEQGLFYKGASVCALHSNDLPFRSTSSYPKNTPVVCKYFHRETLFSTRLRPRHSAKSRWS